MLAFYRPIMLSKFNPRTKFCARKENGWLTMKLLDHQESSLYRKLLINLSKLLFHCQYFWSFSIVKIHWILTLLTKIYILAMNQDHWNRAMKMASAGKHLSGILSCRRQRRIWELKEQRLIVPQVLCHQRYKVIFSYYLKVFKVDLSNLLPTQNWRILQENGHSSFLQEKHLDTWKSSRSEISMLVNSVIIFCLFLQCNL